MSVKATKRPTGILQHGTATGHYHQAQGPDVAVMERGEQVYLLAPKGAEIVHQEHASFHVAPHPEGYDRLLVQQYDHFAEEARNVED